MCLEERKTFEIIWAHTRNGKRSRKKNICLQEKHLADEVYPTERRLIKFVFHEPSFLDTNLWRSICIHHMCKHLRNGWEWTRHGWVVSPLRKFVLGFSLLVLHFNFFRIFQGFSDFPYRLGERTSLVMCNCKNFRKLLVKVHGMFV